jgi:hypothetical protein
MIKKTTLATFRDGDYAGEYDWQGGIPLTIGETIDIKTEITMTTYKLVDKSTTLEASHDEQLVTTKYWFERIL